MDPCQSRINSVIIICSTVIFFSQRHCMTKILQWQVSPQAGSKRHIHKKILKRKSLSLAIFGHMGWSINIVIIEMTFFRLLKLKQNRNNLFSKVHSFFSSIRCDVANFPAICASIYYKSKLFLLLRLLLFSLVNIWRRVYDEHNENLCEKS